MPHASEPGPPASVPVAGARAAIAVLPFASFGADGGGDYFADGLTEDIIAALGRFRDLSVIARAAVFAYKGKTPSPAEVGRDLKVGYVVDGSVRRSAERLRVSASLTDTARSALLWSEKYDVEPKDIFAVQDQITRRISGALALRVTSLELANSASKPPSNLEAYDLVLRGRIGKHRSNDFDQLFLHLIRRRRSPRGVILHIGEQLILASQARCLRAYDVADSR